MPATDIAGATALVTGASRGFGCGIATALSQAGAQVVGVARDRAALDEVRAELGGSFIPVASDAADPVTAGQLIDARRPSPPTGARTRRPVRRGRRQTSGTPGRRTRPPGTCRPWPHPAACRCGSATCCRAVPMT